MAPGIGKVQIPHGSFTKDHDLFGHRPTPKRQKVRESDPQIGRNIQVKDLY